MSGNNRPKRADPHQRHRKRAIRAGGVAKPHIGGGSAGITSGGSVRSRAEEQQAGIGHSNAHRLRQGTRVLLNRVEWIRSNAGGIDGAGRGGDAGMSAGKAASSGSRRRGFDFAGRGRRTLAEKRNFRRRTGFCGGKPGSNTNH